MAQKHFYGLGYILIAVGGLIGGGIGWVGGGVVALVALVEFHQTAAEPGRMLLNVSIAIIVSALIGSISFAGSMVAFGKLQGLVGDRPIVWRGQRVGNIVILLIGITAGTFILGGHSYQLMWLLLIEIAAAPDDRAISD